MGTSKKVGFESYIGVRAWLETFIPLVYGKEELGLVRIEYLLKLLGNPEKKFESIHVAGTSGKGSTAFYISKMLQLSVFGSQLSDESQSVSQLSDKPKTGRPKSENRKQKTDNWKIGLHISPHLVDIRERMQIFENLESRIQNLESSSLMPMGRFLKLFKQVRPVVEKIQKTKPELTPSYFEILVAATFKYFAEEKVDWAVVEVGLGGRLDATNVLQSRIAVITNIGLDHTEILGDTIEKIAFEKAGIIKTKVSNASKVSKVGIPVVTGAKGAALRVIEKVAKEKGAKVVRVKSLHFTKVSWSKRESIEGNFELAEKAVEVALGLSNKSIRKHLSRTQGSTLSISDLSFPGRFEEIDEGVIIDGAHNPDKMKALIHFVRESFFLRHSRVNENQDPRFPSRGGPSFGWREDDSMVDEVILVLAFKKGKDWKKMVDLLIKNLPIRTVIATVFQAVTDTGKFAAVPAEEIAEYLNVKCQMSSIRRAQDDPEYTEGSNVKRITNSQEAVFEALHSTVNGQLSTVIVTGSLYLVGEVRTMWKLPTFA